MQRMKDSVWLQSWMLILKILLFSEDLMNRNLNCYASCLEELQLMEQKLSLPLKPRDLSEIQLLKVLMLVELR